MNLANHSDFEKTLKTCRSYMTERHRLWRRLLDKYALKRMSIQGVDDNDLVRMSRFYPLTRQLIASIAFNYPKVFITVDSEAYARADMILERAANKALEITGAREEIHQVIFDALYCGAGIAKVDYNPPGDDAIAPYVANDDAQEDFPMLSRKDPFKVFVDPLTPPHRIGHARYIIEEMVCPLEYLKKDKRYSNRSRLRPMDRKGAGLAGGDFGADIGAVAATSDEQNALDDAYENEMVRVFEVHDRLSRRLISYAEGVDEPIRVESHPFRKVSPQPVGYLPTADGGFEPQFEDQPGFIVAGGTPYMFLKFDLSSDSFYPNPPMAYVEDLNDMTVESVSRRRGALRRFQRVMLGSRAEQAANPDLEEQIRKAREGDVIWVNDTNAFAPPPFPDVPRDQLGLEADARGYEEEVLKTGEMAAAAPKRTATEAALRASVASLNREWLQSKVGEFYKTVVENFFSIMGDPRYTPEQFVINMADEGQEEQFEVLSQAHFLVKYRIDINAGSMQPLIEQLERDDTLALADRLLQAPEADRGEVLKMMISAFRYSDPDKLLTGQQKADAVKAAQLENVAYLQQGGNPGVTQGEDHQTHLEIHGELLQQMQGQAQQLQQQQAGQPGNLQAAQQVVQVQQYALAVQTHMQEHEQMMAQEAQQLGRPAPAGGNGEAPTDIMGTVQSNASRTAAAVQSETNQPGRGPA